jgi:hypothetical protein
VVELQLEGIGSSSFYWRAYATNSEGTGESEILYFQSSVTTTTAAPTTTTTTAVPTTTTTTAAPTTTTTTTIVPNVFAYIGNTAIREIYMGENRIINVL